MSQYSETSLRVFDRALKKLEGRFSQKQIDAIRELIASGELGNVQKLEEIVAPEAEGDGDR